MMSSPLDNAMQSLLGLSVGDAFGQQYFSGAAHRKRWVRERELPPAPWYVTDDTLMACSIVRSLRANAMVHQDALALDLAAMYTRHSDRGYGGTAHRILRHIHEGEHWSVVAPRVFDGMGSKGNGAAMRAAPIGAYFHASVERVISQAIDSAAVTHAHVEARDAAIAIAVAAAIACRGEWSGGEGLIDEICQAMPDGQVRAILRKASRLPREYSLETATSVLGNGKRLLGIDTVPLVLWCAERHAESFEDALWTLFECGGDVDTTCAMAGSILALCPDVQVPAAWLDAREDISPFLDQDALT